jgi:hypothetical protein
VARYGAIVDVCRALADRDGIEDLALTPPLPRGRPRVPKVVLPPQVLEESTFEHAATLHEQAPVDRFGRHLHVRITRKGTSQPARDLLWRPLLREFVSDSASKQRSG